MYTCCGFRILRQRWWVCMSIHSILFAFWRSGLLRKFALLPFFGVFCFYSPFCPCSLAEALRLRTSDRPVLHDCLKPYATSFFVFPRIRPLLLLRLPGFHSFGMVVMRCVFAAPSYCAHCLASPFSAQSLQLAGCCSAAFAWFFVPGPPLLFRTLRSTGVCFTHLAFSAPNSHALARSWKYFNGRICY